MEVALAADDRAGFGTNGSDWIDYACVQSDLREAQDEHSRLNKAGRHSEIDHVRDATDLVKLIGEHVVLKPRGREHIGLCPFHDDRTPSMAVVTHKGNAFYKCHACGAGGDVFDFVQNYLHMDFGEALRFLAQRAGITLTPWNRESDDESPSGPRRMDVRKANAYATTFFRRALAEETLGADARAVLAQRGVSGAMIEAFQLGYAPAGWDALLTRIRKQSLPPEPFVAAGLIKPRRESQGHFDGFRHRLMFPICDDVGNPIAFGARKINPDDEPKYLNSPESALFNKSRTLYGLHLAKRAIIEKREVVVTEGYTDVIACHQAGVTNVVATLGTALTRDHARVLSKLCDSVVLLFDGDEAGMKAADRALEVFFSEAVDIRICVLPGGKDPDELLRQPGGIDVFNESIRSAVDALQYKIDRFRTGLSRDSIHTISGRQKRFESLLRELADMGFAALPGVRRHLVLARLSEVMGIPIATIDQSLSGFESRQRTPVRETQQPQASATESFGHDASLDSVSPARRAAEHDLLGLIVFEPALALAALEQREISDRVGRALDAGQFADSASRQIAAFIRERVQAGQPAFTVQQLLEALQDQSHRAVASSLYFLGERLGGDDRQNVESAVLAAAEALDACIGREHLAQAMLSDVSTGASSDLADPLARLRSVIEHRKCLDRDAAAIASGVRA